MSISSNGHSTEFPDVLCMDSNKRVLVVGLICIDIVTVCRSYPKEGSDQRFILKEMKRLNVRMDNVVRPSDSNIPQSAVLLNTASGSRTILHSPRKLRELTIEDFAALDLSQYSLIHFEGRNIEETVKMIDYVVKYNEALEDVSERIVISVELEKPRKQDLYLHLPHAAVVVFSQLYSESFGYNSATEAVEGFKNKTKPGAFIICTWGPEGAACGVAGNVNDVVMVPANVPPKVLDTLGAGDTFLAGLLYSLARERKLPACVEFACEIAGHKVASYGYDNILDRSWKLPMNHITGN